MLEGRCQLTSRTPCWCAWLNPVPEKSALLTTGTSKPPNAGRGWTTDGARNFLASPETVAPTKDVENFLAARAVHNELVAEDPVLSRCHTRERARLTPLPSSSGLPR